MLSHRYATGLSKASGEFSLSSELTDAKYLIDVKYLIDAKLNFHIPSSARLRNHFSCCRALLNWSPSNNCSFGSKDYQSLGNTNKSRDIKFSQGNLNCVEGLKQNIWYSYFKIEKLLILGCGLYLFQREKYFLFHKICVSTQFVSRCTIQFSSRHTLILWLIYNLYLVLRGEKQHG